MAFPVDVDATWMNAPDASSEPVYDAGDLRRADAAAFGGSGNLPLGVRGGIAAHATDSLAVTVDGSDVVTVQPGAVVIPGDAVTGTGCYRSAIGAAATGNLTARHATLGRIDLVVFRALDVDVVAGHGAGNRKGRVEIIAGTPSGSPAVPAKPSMAVEIARLTVPATGGGAATVDSSKRTFAVGLGGELLVTTLTQLPATAAPFQRARTLDTGRTYTWTGAAWDDGTWTAYTPTFTAASGGLTLGNFTRSGRFRQVDKTVRFVVVITATAGAGLGTGTYNFGLPVAARNADEVVVAGRQTGPIHVYIGSGASATDVVLSLTSTDASMNSANSGMANGTVVRISGTYEAA